MLAEVPGDPGVHRVVWDMRYAPPVSVEGAAFWEESGAAGPLAPPGAYSVRLTRGDTVFSQPFELLVGPPVDVAREDLLEQFRLLLAIRDRLSDTHDTQQIASPPCALRWLRYGPSSPRRPARVPGGGLARARRRSWNAWTRSMPRSAPSTSS
jgi:hypothetical protein